MAADISSEKINWNTESMQCHNCNTEKKRGKPRILYWVKICFNNKDEIKIFSITVKS